MPIRMKLPSRYNIAINMKYVTCCEEKKGKRGRNVFNINLICELRGNEGQTSIQLPSYPSKWVIVFQRSA